MATPTVAGFSGSNSGGNVTTTTPDVATLTGTPTVGDLVIIAVAKDGTGAFTWPAGWTALASLPVTFASTNNQGVLEIRYRVWQAGDSNPGITHASEGTAWQVYRIDVNTFTAGNAPACAVITGDGSNPNPTALNPAGWDVEDTLWLAVAANDGNAAITAGPANYTSFRNDRWANNGGVGIASARRANSVASEDPGTFTMGSEQWGAATIAVRAGIIGTTSSTLGDVTSSAAGTIPSLGTATPTLDALTASAVGVVPIQGSAAATLDALAVSAAAVVDVQGSAAQTLAAATLAADGTVSAAGIVGDAAITLDAATVAAAGVVPVQGSTAATLADCSAAAAGASPVQGTAAPTLADVTVSADASVPIVAVAVVDLAAITSSAAGVVLVQATAFSVLSSLSAAGAGVIPVNGTLASTLDDATVSAAGGSTTAIQGDLAQTLAAASLSATGDLPVQGAAGVTLEALALAAGGGLPVNGSAAPELGPLIVTAAGGVSVEGAADDLLAPLTSSAAGAVLVAGDLTTSLADASCSAAGGSHQLTRGDLSVTLSPVVAGDVAAVVTMSLSLTAAALLSVGPGSASIAAHEIAVAALTAQSSTDLAIRVRRATEAGIDCEAA